MIGKTTRRSFVAAIAGLPLVNCLAADSFSPPITALAFSPDGKQIVAGSQAGVMIVDATSGDVIKSIDAGMDNVHDVQFAPDANALVVAGGVPAETGMVQVLQWPTLARQQTLQIHDDVIYKIDFAADGSHWVTASGDQVCSVIKTGTEKPVTRFTRHSRGVMGAVFLPDKETIVSGSRDETLRVWNASSGENLRTLHNHSRDVLDLAVKPTSGGLPMVASASADFTVRFWQPTIGRMVRFARLPSEPLCIAWCAGDKLIAGCRDGSARLVNSQTVQIESTFPLSDGWLFAVAVSPTNDRHLVFGTTNGGLHRLDV